MSQPVAPITDAARPVPWKSSAEGSDLRLWICADAKVVSKAATAIVRAKESMSWLGYLKEGL